VTLGQRQDNLVVAASDGERSTDPCTRVESAPNTLSPSIMNARHASP
jgi:hypothetical protein